jgi:hypothetical protein
VGASSGCVAATTTEAEESSVRSQGVGSERAPSGSGFDGLAPAGRAVDQLVTLNLGLGYVPPAVVTLSLVNPVRAVAGTMAVIFR